MADRYAINRESLTGIADAVRGMRYEKGELTPAQIEAKIRASHLGIPISVSNHIGPDGKWQRPAEYPDLDSIDIPDDFDGVYLTYDLRKTPGYGWIGITAATKKTYGVFYVERGHLEDEAFVTDESYETASTQYFRMNLEDENGEIQLWRVRSDDHLTRVHFATNTTTSAQNYVTSLQPCVERIGKLAYITDLRSESITGSGWNSWRYTTFWLERDAVQCGGKGVCTRMDSIWIGAYSLQSLDVSGWDTSEWTITNLASAWSACYSLRELDLSHWNTSNWGVKSLNAAWSQCYSLKVLNTDGWDTSSWEVTDLSNIFSNCNSLRSLNLLHWDVSNWKCGSLYCAWNNCYSLENLNVSNWDTSGWKVTSLQSAWQNCYKLQKFDPSNWDTSNWEVTTLDGAFNGCLSLENLDVSKWNTSNWRVTTLYNAFPYMCSLQELDLSKWDVSGWALTDTRYMLGTLYGIKKLLLPDNFSFNSANVTGTPNDSRLLTEYNGYGIYYNHSYANCFSLTPASLRSILNRLPTVTAARTITLGQKNRLKLTEAEIAIATQKGWTVA